SLVYLASLGNIKMEERPAPLRLPRSPEAFSPDPPFLDVITKCVSSWPPTAARWSVLRLELFQIHTLGSGAAYHTISPDCETTRFLRTTGTAHDHFFRAVTDPQELACVATYVAIRPAILSTHRLTSPGVCDNTPGQIVRTPCLTAPWCGGLACLAGTEEFAVRNRSRDPR